MRVFFSIRPSVANYKFAQVDKSFSVQLQNDYGGPSGWCQTDQLRIVFAPGKMLPAQVLTRVKQRDYPIGFRITSLCADAF
jgi:hypothetical protein